MQQAKFVDVDGIRTRYFEGGSGDPLLLVHGGTIANFYSGYCWSLNVDELAENFHVYAIDRLGMGHTDNPKKDQDYAFQATIEHAHNFMAKMGMRRAKVAGHSRGALVAATLAVEHPEIVDTLIIVDTNTLAPPPKSGRDSLLTNPFYEKIAQAEPDIPTRESVLMEPRANSFSHGHITEDFVEDMYQIAKLPKTLEAKTKMKKLNKSVYLPQLAKRKKATLELIRAGRLKQPTLITWSLDDPSAPFVKAIRLFRLIGPRNERTQLHAFTRAGHYLFREHPKDFDKVVRDFILGE